MVMSTTTGAFDSAANLYLGWLDASLDANERFACVARAWLDETVGVQQDMTQALKRSIEETQAALTQDDEPLNPFAFVNRAGDIARSGYSVWTEAGLKAQERFSRVAQLAFEELSTAQSEFSSRAEEQMLNATRRS